MTKVWTVSPIRLVSWPNNSLKENCFITCDGVQTKFFPNPIKEIFSLITSELTILNKWIQQHTSLLLFRQLTTAWQHISTRSNGWIHQWISYKQGTLSQVPSHFKIFFKSSVLLAKYYSIKEVSTPAKLLSLKLEAHKPFKVYISTLVWYRKSTIFPVLHQYLLASIVKVTFKTSYRYYLTLDVFCYFASCWIQWYLESIKPNC